MKNEALGAVANSWYYEYLERIANIELKNKPSQQGGTELRYRVARDQQGPSPICEQIAGKVVPRLGANTVILVTGTGNPTWLPYGETDGPSGVAVLARVFAGLGVRSCIVSEARFLPGIAASVRAAGTPLQTEDAWVQRSNGALLLEFPVGAAPAQAFVDGLLHRLPDVAAGFFVEKPGPNAKGVFHNSSGKPKDGEWIAHANLLAWALRAKGIPTVGVGDGGNEIGFGRIRDQLVDLHPFGQDCGCPCHGGLIDATQTDWLLPAAVSNWGAYAIAAAIALTTGRPSVFPQWEQVRNSVIAPLSEGAVDGYSGMALDTVDGTSLEANKAIYSLMQEVLRLATERLE